MGFPNSLKAKAIMAFVFAKGLFEALFSEDSSTREVAGVDDRIKTILRLVNAMGFSPHGVGAFHYDLAVRIIALACRLPDGWPTSPEELSERLVYDVLAAVYDEESLGDITPQEVRAVKRHFDALVQRHRAESGSAPSIESGGLRALLPETTG